MDKYVCEKLRKWDGQRESEHPVSQSDIDTINCNHNSEEDQSSGSLWSRQRETAGSVHGAMFVEIRDGLWKSTLLLADTSLHFLLDSILNTELISA